MKRLLAFLLLAVFSVAQTNSGPVNVQGNIVMADKMTGSDAGAKIAAGCNVLPLTGGTVDARGFGGAISAAETITLSRPCKVVLPAGTFTLSGKPGISITANGITVVGHSALVSNQSLNDVSATILKSGSAGVLIQDNGQSGTVIQDVELDGNNVGLIGVYHPYGGDINIIRPRVERFVYEGLYLNQRLTRNSRLLR
jgi:hypothetical protein